MKSELVGQQQAFQDYVLNGDEEIVARIAGNERVDPQRRLRIYFDAYRLRLIEALATDFEALRKLLGDDDFNRAARAYIETTPSTFRNVRWYGGTLSEFLGTTAPWSERRELHELALFEWTLSLAFDADDAPIVRFELLAQQPAEAWPTLRFVPHPSAHVIALHTNAQAMRKASDEEIEFPAIETHAEPIRWLIWRKDLGVCFRSLSEPEAWALQAVRDEADFTQLCEGLCEWYAPEDAAGQAAQLLRQWVEDELLTDVRSS